AGRATDPADRGVGHNSRADDVGAAPAVTDLSALSALVTEGGTGIAVRRRSAPPRPSSVHPCPVSGQLSPAGGIRLLY
ncbi:hypothetical protein ACWDVV_31070, partial [Streptomyces tendae]